MLLAHVAVGSVPGTRHGGVWSKAMIFGDDFVWIHQPKCGGTATEKLLGRLLRGKSGVSFDPIDENKVIWHHTIAERRAHDPAFSVGDRVVICGFRRLPSWLLSRVHYEAHRTRRLPSRGQLLRGQVYEHHGLLNHADRYVKDYAKTAQRLTRMEHLAEDIHKAFGDRSAFAGVTMQDITAAMKRSNDSPMPYVKAIDFWFTPRELTDLYEACPVWAEVEKDLYGNLLSEL